MRGVKCMVVEGTEQSGVEESCVFYLFHQLLLFLMGVGGLGKMF